MHVRCVRDADTMRMDIGLVPKAMCALGVLYDLYVGFRNDSCRIIVGLLFGSRRLSWRCA